MSRFEDGWPRLQSCPGNESRGLLDPMVILEWTIYQEICLYVGYHLPRAFDHKIVDGNEFMRAC